MNSKGGYLLMGVGDDKTIIGLEKDLARLHDSLDQFELTFTELINTYIGKIRRPLVDLKWEKINDKQIAVARVTKSPRPVYVRYDNNEDFCIREGNATTTLGVSEATDYIRDHWPALR
jgi:predicted HTH transcriptional regulator